MIRITIRPGRQELAHDRNDGDEAAGLRGEPEQRGAVDGGDHGGRAGVGDLGRLAREERRDHRVAARPVARMDVLDHGVAAP